jgi:mannose-6-phosphate isomerase-like protein (cupin superfamily)
MKPDLTTLKHFRPTGIESFTTLPCCYGTKAIPANPCLQGMALCHVTLPPHGETVDAPNEIGHYHERITELYCFLGGTGRIFLNGQWIPVKAGSVVAVPPMTYHNVRAAEHGLTMLVWTNPAYCHHDSFDLTELPQQGFATHDPRCLCKLKPEIERADLRVGSFYQSGDFSLSLTCLEAEASVCIHDHADEEQAYFVVDGSAEVVLGANTHWVSAGSYLAIPKGIRHGITAGREGVLYYEAETPPVRNWALRPPTVNQSCLVGLPLGGVY